MPILNDIHSQLNETAMRRVVKPRTAEEVQQAIAAVRDEGGSLSIAGGRHAMGGQQFLDGGVLIDAGNLNRILELGRGARAGARGSRHSCGTIWCAGCVQMQRSNECRWSIVQKQTGADRLSIGGALAANGHGRGLTYKPIVQDVESFELVDASGTMRYCSRTENIPSYSVSPSEATGCSA